MSSTGGSGSSDGKDPHIADLDRPIVNRIFWFSMGFISMIIGLIGIPVPGLPTTPLMILAAACFARSSQRFYDLILNNKMFGHHVRTYREGRGIPRRIKPVILGVMWVFVSFAVFVGIPDSAPAISKYFTVILAVIGTLFILRIPSFDTEEKSSISH